MALGGLISLSDRRLRFAVTAKAARRRRAGCGRVTLMGALRRASRGPRRASWCCGAAAGDPADRLPDPAKEAHARALFRDIRCLVCQNESIDESDAPLAHDLRQLVRQQVAAGRSDAQIRAFLVSRYGQFVLLTPKASLGNAILWIGPLLVVVAGAAALFTRRRTSSRARPVLAIKKRRASRRCHAKKRADTFAPHDSRESRGDDGKVT